MKYASNGASVSPEALGAFFAEEPIRMPTRSLFLNNLGLNDNHCAVIAQELARQAPFLSSVNMLDLTGNPSIGQLGYEALLGLLNRRCNIGAVFVDDQKWESIFDLVVFMNRLHQRSRFLENGVFRSKAMWVDFLAGISANRFRSEEDEEDIEEDDEDEVRKE